MTDVIESFTGEWKALSNFERTNISYEGVLYPTVEHAFQAAKTMDQSLRLRIATTRLAGEAKSYGRRLHLRDDWEDVKESIMLELLTRKFDDSGLARVLTSTGDAILIEGNTWHDQHWGDCRCETHVTTPGKNRLGELLMQVRSTNRLKGVR